EPPRSELSSDHPERALGPVILWNHRWEHDKDPEAFFAALRPLHERGVPFRVAVCGRQSRRAPAVLEQARAWLGARVVHWGTCEGEAAYRELLSRAQLAVSTAVHEFFGIAMVEATHLGAEPLVPDRLAYPEIFPAEHRYPDPAALVERLEARCRAWVAGAPLRADRRGITAPYRAQALLPRYHALFRRVLDEGPPPGP